MSLAIILEVAAMEIIVLVITTLEALVLEITADVQTIQIGTTAPVYVSVTASCTVRINIMQHSILGKRPLQGN